MEAPPLQISVSEALNILENVGVMSLVELPLILVFVLCGACAVLGMMIPERRNPTLTAVAGSLAAAAALWAGGGVLCGGGFHGELWTIRSVGTLGIWLDRLSALFLVVAAVVVLASSVFSASYLKRYAGHYSLRAFNAGYLLLIASVVWILIADDVLGFLLAWEAMSILSYLLVNFEHQREGTNHAAYLMLATGGAGFIAVELVLLFLAAWAGSMGCYTVGRNASRPPERLRCVCARLFAHNSCAVLAFIGPRAECD